MANSPKIISVLGCGWLGLPLAERLQKERFVVQGSTTSPDKLRVLESRGIKAFCLQCGPEVCGEGLKRFFKADVLVIMIPFKRSLSDPEFYRRQIESAAMQAQASGIGFVVFTSSTSVYPEKNSEARESDEIIPSGVRARVLLDIEQNLIENPHFSTTIVRFAGLYGYDRRIGKFLSGKKLPGRGDVPVNLIHQDDAVEILFQIITRDVRGETFNACSDGHPPRKELYTKAARSMGGPPPEFDGQGPTAYKIVSNQKIKERLGYRFKYPDPRDVNGYGLS